MLVQVWRLGGCSLGLGFSVPIEGLGGTVLRTRFEGLESRAPGFAASCLGIRIEH